MVRANVVVAKNKTFGGKEFVQPTIKTVGFNANTKFARAVDPATDNILEMTSINEKIMKMKKNTKTLLHKMSYNLNR